jgi:hypothetical protein
MFDHMIKTVMLTIQSHPITAIAGRNETARDTA